MVSPIIDQLKLGFMLEAITNQYFIKNFVTVKHPGDDTGPEIILDGQAVRL